MNRGLVNLRELRENIRNADFEGKSAFCFIEGNKLIKVYARKEDKRFFIPLDVNKLYDFSNFKADTIVFPEEYIYENGKMAGEILKYINNKTIYEAINGRIVVDSLIKSFELVVNDLQLYNNIYMKDLSYVNILYSGNKGLHLIDTTEWQLTNNNNYKVNLSFLNTSLVIPIINYLKLPIYYDEKNNCNVIDLNFYNNLDKYGRVGKELQKNIDLILNEKYRFLELMFSYMNLYNYYYGKDMNKLKDMQEMTKVLKKG